MANEDPDFEIDEDFEPAQMPSDPGRPLLSFTPDEGERAFGLIEQGSSPREMARRIRLERLQSASAADVEPSALSGLQAGAIGAGNAATGGNIAGLSAAFDFADEGGTFAERRAQGEGDLREAQELQPGASATGELVGLVAPAAGGMAGGALGAGRSLLGRKLPQSTVSTVASQTPRQALNTVGRRALPEGAAWGAAQGALSTTTGAPADIAKHAAIGTGMGLAGGAVGSLIPAGVTGLVGSGVFKRAMHKKTAGWGEDADLKRALTVSGATGGSINAPPVLREIERMPGGVPAFAEELRRSGLGGITTTARINKGAARELESSGKKIGQMMDEATDKGGMVDVEALVGRLRAEAASAGGGMEGVSDVAQQHARELSRMADKIEKRMPTGGFAPIRDIKAMGVSLGEDAQQAYRAKAAGRPVTGKGYALMDARRASEGGIGDAIEAAGSPAERMAYAEAKRRNQMARIAQEASETSLGRASKNNLIGLTSAVIGAKSPLLGIVHHVARPLMASGRATWAEGARGLGRFMRQEAAPAARSAPMQAGNARFAPLLRGGDSPETANMPAYEAERWSNHLTNEGPDIGYGEPPLRATESTTRTGAGTGDNTPRSLLTPEAPDTRASVLRARRNAETSNMPATDEVRTPTADMHTGGEGYDTVRSLLGPKKPQASTPDWNVDEGEALSWPTMEDLNEHAIFQARGEGGVAMPRTQERVPRPPEGGDVEQLRERMNAPTGRRFTREQERMLLAERERGPLLKAPDPNAIADRHAREDRLPRKGVLQMILSANGIDASALDTGQGGTAYRAWVDNGRKGPKPAGDGGSLLDEFNDQILKDGRKNPASSLEEAVDRAVRDGLVTFRELRDSDLLKAIGRAAGKEDLAFPTDVEDRLLRQDLELRDLDDSLELLRDRGHEKTREPGEDG